MLFSIKTVPTYVEKFASLNPYVARIGSRPSTAQKQALENVKKHEFSRMSGTEDEANFLALLCKMSGYKVQDVWLCTLTSLTFQKATN